MSDHQNPPSDESEVNQKKIMCGLLGILLGWTGVHKFILGYKSTGIITLLISVVVLGIGLVIMNLIGFIEGIIYLTKSNREFYDTYIAGEKKWF